MEVAELGSTASCLNYFHNNINHLNVVTNWPVAAIATDMGVSRNSRRLTPQILPEQYYFSVQLFVLGRQITCHSKF